MKQAAFLLLIVLAAVALVMHPTGAKAQSWLNGWAERIPVTISNSGDQLTNYQVEVELDRNFRFMIAKPVGSDVQVTGADGLTPIGFWIQDWDSVAMKATVYVKAPTLASGTNVVYLYYGNQAATNASSAAAVFDFYDGFEAPFANAGAAMANAPAPQITPTYDGSGQVVHPGIVYFPSGWNGFNYWLAVEPYPYSNAVLENPSILVSNDGATWQVPPGLTNPIAIHSGQPNLADGELLYDDTSNSLFLYYNQDYVAPGTLGFLKISDSTGVNWGPELTILAVPQDDILSQAVVKVGSGPAAYSMWYVDSYGGGWAGGKKPVKYRTSPDGINWSGPTTLPTFSIPGYSMWHPDVIYVPSKGEYWSVMAAYPSGQSCANTSLFFARSTDGINWTVYAQPVLTASSGWDNQLIYRSTLLYDPTTDRLQVWYSAEGTNGQWNLGYTERNYSALLASLTSTWTTTGTGSWTQSTNPVK